MSLRVFVVAAAFGVASTIGHSGAAGQSAQPSSKELAAALRILVESGPDSPSIWQAPPQQVGRNRTRGAMWGGGIGLVAGGLVGGLSADADDGGGFDGSLTESAATGEAVLLGAVVGAGIGALLGATILAPSHRSTSADGDALRLSLHPSGPAVVVSGRVRIGR